MDRGGALAALIAALVLTPGASLISESGARVSHNRHLATKSSLTTLQMSTTDAATPRPTKRAWSGGVYGAHTKVEHDVVAAQFDQHVLKTCVGAPADRARARAPNLLPHVCCW
jgi:hypothetical protein